MKSLIVFHLNSTLSHIEDIDNLIASEEIDAVYIATPHSTHYEYSLLAIKNKKHILCEKPITINHLESMVLLNLAKEKEVFLMEAYMYRVHPQTFNILDNLSIFDNTKNKITITSSFGFSADLPESHRLRNQHLWEAELFLMLVATHYQWRN